MTDVNIYDVLSLKLSKEEAAEKINIDKALFNEALRLSVTDETPYNWRAAWMLDQACKKNDKRIHNLNELIDAVLSKKDGHQRELIKLISNFDLDEEQEARFFDVCLSVWERVSKSPSVRYFAFKQLISFIDKYPELSSELRHVFTEEYIEPLSPGVKSGVNKAMKKYYRF